MLKKRKSERTQRKGRKLEVEVVKGKGGRKKDKTEVLGGSCKRRKCKERTEEEYMRWRERGMDGG